MRVSYRGREDGWVLTANKRGPTLVPSEDQAAAVGEFDAQEAAFAAEASSNADGALPEDAADRPLTGAKPRPAPAASVLDAAGAAGEDRPLGGGGKGAWVPPSEFPPGHEAGLESSGERGDKVGTEHKAAAEDVVAVDGSKGGSTEDVARSTEYMTSLG